MVSVSALREAEYNEVNKSSCFHLGSLCVLSRYDIIVETPTVTGNTTEVVLGTLTRLYKSACLWNDDVTMTATQQGSE